jgi:hypothetical protein
MKSVDGMTPFEAWHWKKPAVHHLMIFGCIVYVQNTTSHLKKLEDRGRKMIFISYESGSKAYRTYNPITKCAHVTRDVVFNKQDQWDRGTGSNDGEPGGGDDVFTVEYTIIGQVVLEIERADEEHVEQSMLPAMNDDVEVDKNIDVDHDDIDDDNDALLHFRSINDNLRMAGFAPRALVAEELNAVSSDKECDVGRGDFLILLELFFNREM